eukprot:2339769-Alexandrium_andersonii.AAC.1
MNASGQKPSGRTQQTRAAGIRQCDAKRYKRSNCEGTICRSRANAPNAAAASRTPWRRPGDARWTASRRRAVRRSRTPLPR